LLDLAETIPAVFGLDWPGHRPGSALQQIAQRADDLDREVVSQYHAAGSVSAAYMLRKGRWKYIEYVGFEPELFDLVDDPGEAHDLSAAKPDVVAEMAQALRQHLDPDAVDAAAFADQDALIAGFGGIEAAAKLGARGATPAPKLG
jgi:choline-sulfatase